MANRATPTKSFNTVKHSNRKKRLQRQQNERIVLLGILCVTALLIVALLVFGICAIVHNIRDNSTKNPNGGAPAFVMYENITQSSDGLLRGELILINQSHYFDPAQATGLKTIYGNQPTVNNGLSRPYGLADNTWKLNETALNALNAMMLRHYEISGDASLVVGSAYRTAKDQENMPSSSVLPGYSDHHSGYCLTLKYVDRNLEETHWVFENAHRYGFIVRYPEDKAAITGVSGYSWCLRYVGVAHATYMYQNNLCLEEYVEMLHRSYSGGANLAITGSDGNAYEVYYVPKTGDVTTVKVPSNYNYTVSGDNDSGFIVTILLSQPK